MIYVSSSCIKAETIRESVFTLAKEGFRNIELSGGTIYYDDFAKDLVELKNRFDLNYRVHNYFPPPKEDFILNIASLDRDIYDKSLGHLEKGLGLTELLGINQFSFHAGFYVDRPVSELGKVFNSSELYDKNTAINQFCEGFNSLQQKFDDIKIYVENNCYSSSNFFNYGDNIPFMLLSYYDYKELKTKIDFNLLLDIGHLLVSSRTLGFDFEKELQVLFQESDYIHISDNDALHDQNLGIHHGCGLAKKLENLDWSDKTVTLEIYEGLEALKTTFDVMSSL